MKTIEASVWSQHAIWFVGKILPYVLATIVLVAILFLVSGLFKNRGLRNPTSRPFQFHLIFGLVLISLFLCDLIVREIGALNAYFDDLYNGVTQIPYIATLLGITLVSSLPHFLIPRVLKLRLNTHLAWLQTGLTIVGLGLLALPQLSFSIALQPRRYLDSTRLFEILNIVVLIGLIFLMLGAAAFALLLVEALVKRRLL